MVVVVLVCQFSSVDMTLEEHTLKRRSNLEEQEVEKVNHKPFWFRVIWFSMTKTSKAIIGRIGWG